MTAKIKLNSASGGGSFSLQAPSSSSNNRVMTLPDTADGTILTTTNPKAGNIIQIRQALKTDVQSIVDVSSDTDLIGLSETMTLNSSSNKILISYSVILGADWWNLGPVGIRVLDGSTPIGIGTTGTTKNFTTTANFYANGQPNSAHNINNQVCEFLYSPGDTNSHTYKLQANGQTANGCRVNASWSDTTRVMVSSLTLKEVAV